MNKRIAKLGDCLKEQNDARILGVMLLVILAFIAISVWVSNQGVLAPPSSGGYYKQEKVAIQKLIGNATTATITVYAESTGDGPVVLDSAFIKDSQGSVKEIIKAPNIDDYDVDTAATVPTIAAELTRLDITTTQGTMVVGESYTLTLVTQIGGSFRQSFNATGVTPDPYPW